MGEDLFKSLIHFQNEGLIALSPTSLTVTPIGKNFIRNICHQFEQYMSAKPSLGKGFSMAI
jgi:coproporphyrinogen III oxidase-like Fe-S oxidoreductase